MKPFVTEVAGQDYRGFMGENNVIDFRAGDKIEFDGTKFTTNGQVITGYKPATLLEDLLSDETIKSDADTPEKEEVAEDETIQINNINELKNGEMIVVVERVATDGKEVNAANLPTAQSTFYFLDEKENTYKSATVPIGTILQINMTQDSKFRWKVIKSPSGQPPVGSWLVSPPNMINQACSQRLVAKVRGDGFGTRGSDDPVKALKAKEDAAVNAGLGMFGRMLG